jgi:hypothetical protein
MFIIPFYTHAPRRVGVQSRHASVGAAAEAVAEAEVAAGAAEAAPAEAAAAEAKAVEAAAGPNSGSLAKGDRIWEQAIQKEATLPDALYREWQSSCRVDHVDYFTRLLATNASSTPVLANSGKEEAVCRSCLTGIMCDMSTCTALHCNIMCEMSPQAVNLQVVRRQVQLTPRTQPDAKPQMHCRRHQLKRL